jgi:DNA helicase II / ATP-dependent DNA helicase PcrA
VGAGSIGATVLSPEEILAPLNPGQRAAAVLTGGPVAIVAGAGTGKTTTIARRVAYQVATGAFRPYQILAVTFTEKAAGELRERLRALGVEGVEARTFHSAALSQLSRLWTRHSGEPLGEVLEAKAPLIASLANALPAPHKFVPRRDLASEIEWAKNRMVQPQGYLDELTAADHVPPIPPGLMLQIYDRYERRKRTMGRLDFEDMLSLALRMFDRYPGAAHEVRARYASFTVDEYQDVNPLQAALLDRWLGGRDDLCVVGDDHQTIYGFTGATPSHLLHFRDRFPHARIVRLEENYRSSPEVLAVANRLAGHIGGFHKTLRATRPSGPAVVMAPIRSGVEEADSVVDHARSLHDAEGVAYEEMAVLYRINARSEPFEEAFADAHIPYQVRDGAFLRRPGPRAAIARLRREEGRPVTEAVERVTAALGLRDGPAPGEAGSDEEITRQADLNRLRVLAREFTQARPDGDVAGFLAELSRRFSAEESGRGVHLMTYHRAKGLEFDAVFLPKMLDGELPFRSGRSRAPVDEERRLLYVGITRARRHLHLSWQADARNGPSPFLKELGAAAQPPSPAPKPSTGRREAVGHADPAAFDALKKWRLERAKADGIPAYVIFHDSTLASIAERRPRTLADLHAVSGVGPAKLKRYGREVLAVVESAPAPGRYSAVANPMGHATPVPPRPQ